MIKKIKDLFIKYRKLIVLFISLIIFILIARDIFQKEIIKYDVWAHNVLVENLRSRYNN